MLNTNLPITSNATKSHGLVGIALAFFSVISPAADLADEISRNDALRSIELQREQELRRKSESKPFVAPLSSSKTAPSKFRSLGPELKDLPRRPVADEAPCQSIHTIELQTSHPQDLRHFTWLNEFAASFEHHCLGRRSLELLLLTLNERLQERGYLTTRALFEPQNLASGTLQVRLQVGKVGRLTQTHQGSGRALGLNAFPTGPGHILNVRDLDQGIENLQRLPSTQVEIALQPHAGDPTQPTNIDIRTLTRRPWQMQFTIDNSSPKEYGGTQGSTAFSYDNPLGLSDQLFVSLSNNLEQLSPQHRNSFGYFSWQLPVGSHLLTLRHTTSRTARMIQGTSTNFLSRSQDENTQIQWQTTLWRNAQAKLSGHIAHGHRHARSQLDDIELVTQRRDSRSLEAGLALNWLFENGANLDLNLSRTTLTKRNSTLEFSHPDDPRHAHTDRLYVNFSKPIALNAPTSESLHAATSAPRYLTYQASLNVQTTRHPNTLSDTLALGGRYSVRGFSGETTLNGYRGAILRQELGWPAFAVKGETTQSAPHQSADSTETHPVLSSVVPVISPYVALDAGLLWGEDTHALPRRSLAGLALGCRIHFQGSPRWRSLSLDLSVGTALRRPSHWPRQQWAPTVSLSYSL
jgi:hemolysin activation/secretion protein